MKLGNFKTVHLCRKWLGEIDRGENWDAHMQAATVEFTRKAEEEWEAMRLENAMQGNGTSLFEVGAA